MKGRLKSRTGKKANTSVTLTGSSFTRLFNLIDRLQRKKKAGEIKAHERERERERDAKIFS